MQPSDFEKIIKLEDIQEGQTVKLEADTALVIDVDGDLQSVDIQVIDGVIVAVLPNGQIISIELGEGVDVNNPPVYFADTSLASEGGAPVVDLSSLSASTPTAGNGGADLAGDGSSAGGSSTPFLNEDGSLGGALSAGTTSSGGGSSSAGASSGGSSSGSSSSSSSSAGTTSSDLPSLSSLTPAEIAAMDPVTLASYPAAEIATLNAAQAAVLTAAQVSALAGAERLDNLSDVAEAGLAAGSLADLTAAQIAVLTDEFVESLAPATVASLSDTQLGALTDDQIGSIAASGGLGDVTSDQLAILGVTGVDDPEEFALLTDVLSTPGIATTVAELQAVADAVQSVMDAAAGAANKPTLAELETLGFTDVPAASIATIQAAIAATADDGTGIDSVAEIQAILDNVAADVAWEVIADYADNGVTAPTLQDYLDAGVTSVTADNLAAVNVQVEAVTGDAANSAEEIDALADLANATLATIEAYNQGDGVDPAALDVSDYEAAGIEGVSADNLAAVNAQVLAAEAGGADSVGEITDLVAAANAALDKIENFDGTDPATLTLEDYAAAGITGVSEDNLAAVNAQVLAAAVDGADSVADIAGLVAAANTALDKIESYNATNGTSPATLSLEDYEAAGITGVDVDNLADVNAAISAQDTGAADTVGEIQGVVDNVATTLALALIDAYADNGVTEPTLQDYIDAGVTGVTDDNIAAVNAQVEAVAAGDADSVEEIQALVTAANDALAVIENFDGVDPAALTEAHYAAAGIDGVSIDNLAAVNAQVLAAADGGADSVGEITQIVADADAALDNIDNGSERINPLTLEDYAAAGITGVTEENLLAVNANVYLAAPDGADAVGEINAFVIAADAAVATVETFNNSDGSSPLIYADYLLAGVSDADSNDITAINQRILAAGPGDADTTAEIQVIVDATNTAIDVIKAYANGTTSTALTVEEYEAAGITGVSEDNLVAVNAQVVASGFVFSSNIIQNLVTAADAALEKIELYNQGDGTTPAALSVEDYEAAGITGVDAENLDAVNAAILAQDAQGADTVPEIQGLVDGITLANALTVIQAYADGGVTVPTVTDYEEAGVEGVNAANLALVNAEVDTAVNNAADVDTVGKIQALVDGVLADALAKIEDYNNGDGTTPAALSADDYTAAGVEGVSDDNLAAVNAQVLAEGIGGADSVDEINALVQLADDALAKIEAYNNGDGTTPAPLSVADYEAAGITDVTFDNLNAVNAAILAAATGGADTVAEIQTLVTDAATAFDTAFTKVTTYAVDSVTAPDAADYAALGITGVDTEDDAVAMNAAIDLMAGTDVTVGTADDSADVDTIAKIQALANDLQAGTAGVNSTLTGTSSEDILVGGTGDDTLISNGGTDILLGGAGDDIIQINADSITALESNDYDGTRLAQIDGGEDSDTLKLDGSDTHLDLTAIDDDRITNIEVIDLTDSGNNTVTLAEADVLALSSTTDALRIEGNAGDTVVLNPNVINNVTSHPFVLTGTEEVNGTTYNVYTSDSGASLSINENVAVDTGGTPAAPTITSVGDDVGVNVTLSSGDTTDDNQLEFRIDITDNSIVPGDVLTLTDASTGEVSDPYTLTAQDVLDGYIIVTTNELPYDASYNISAKITDAAGNESNNSGGFSVTVQQAQLNYSTETFKESAANDGSVDTAITVTLDGDTFNAGIDSNDVVLTDLPDGFTGYTVTYVDANTVTISLIGSATAHNNTEDTSQVAITSPTVTFADSAFTASVSANVDNSTQTLNVDFSAPSTLNYTGSFTEIAASNDGSIAGELIVDLASTTGVTFDAALTSNSDVAANLSSFITLTNVPAGLTVALTVVNDTQLRFTLTDTANSHSIDVENIGIAFTDAAFAGESATVIENSSHTFGIDFVNTGELAVDSLIINAAEDNGTTVTGTYNTAGDPLSVTVHGTTYTESDSELTLNAGAGTWTLDLSGAGLNDSTYDVIATQGEFSDSSSGELIVDTSTSVAVQRLGSDDVVTVHKATGQSQGIGFLSIQGEAGGTATIDLVGQSGTVQVVHIFSDNGVDGITLTESDIATLGAGAVDVSVTLVDAAGNETTFNKGVADTTQNFTLDTTTPQIGVTHLKVLDASDQELSSADISDGDTVTIQWNAALDNPGMSFPLANAPTVNLSPWGGDESVAMTHVGGGVYELDFTPTGIVHDNPFQPVVLVKDSANEVVDSQDFEGSDLVLVLASDSNGDLTFNTRLLFETNARIDWNNDGDFDQYGSETSNSYHVGTPAGTLHTIRINGGYGAIANDQDNIISVEQWGDYASVYQYGGGWLLQGIFSGSENVDINAIDSPVLTVNNQQFQNMFKSDDVDPNNIKFNSSINDWDVSNVVGFSQMFSNTLFNQDLDQWDMSKATDLSSIFVSASLFNGDISTWETGNVIAMNSMFQSASVFNQDLNDWDTSSVETMEKMFFKSSSFNGDISDWDVSSVTNMSRMFSEAIAFNSDITGWDVSSVTNMSYMFNDAESFSQDIGLWGDTTANVTDMSYMFNAADSFNGDISGWDVSNVTTMERMFNSALAFNQDLGQWDVSSVENFNKTFNDADAFVGDISSWDTSAATDMSYMFASTQLFNGDVGAWDVSSVTNMDRLLFKALAFDQDLGRWDISSVQSAQLFLDQAKVMSTANIDKLLSGWADVNTSHGETRAGDNSNGNIVFGFDTKHTYTDATAHQYLIDNGWTFVDDILAAGVTAGTSATDAIDLSAETTEQAIHGLGGDDTIAGGSAADLIVGGAGNDTLTGNGGADIFKYSFANAGNDTITDFDAAGGDILDLSVLLDGYGITSDDINDFITVSDNGGSAMLSIDANGDGSGADVTITLTGVPSTLDINAAIAAGNIVVLEDGVSGTTYGTVGTGNTADTLDNSASTDNLDIYGLDGDDVITGGEGNDRIWGGTGDDTINLSTGADSVSGGAGDDTFNTDALTVEDMQGPGRQIIDGGEDNSTLASGTIGNSASAGDALIFSGAGLTLDFSIFHSSKVTGMEKVDITGSGDNTLTLSMDDVLVMTDSANTLLVDADVGDTVNLTGFTDSGNDEGGYAQYTNGSATVWVDEDASVAFA